MVLSSSYYAVTDYSAFAIPHEVCICASCTSIKNLIFEIDIYTACLGSIHFIVFKLCADYLGKQASVSYNYHCVLARASAGDCIWKCTVLAREFLNME